jgi:choline dehydrogenase-like flavoprotein
VPNVIIIVGAGSAGAMIANRLSEVSDWNALLLEAGDEESLSGQIPVFAVGLQLTDLDWQYKTTPQDNACQGYLNQKYAFDIPNHFLIFLKNFFINE